MSVTKETLSKTIAERLELPKKQSVAILESILNIMKRSLQSGEDILISGFGKFTVKEKKDRRGRHPQTGEAITLEARRVVRFHHSKVLRGKIDGKE